MSKLLVKDKEVVVPGEILAEGMDYLPSYGTYRDSEKIICQRLGVANIDGNVLKIVPLTGKYVPRRDDVIIGKIIDVSFSGWRVDTNSAYPAMLNVKDATSSFIAKGADLTRFFNLGDYITTRIINVTSQKLLDLTMKEPGLRKIEGGRIIKVDPNKVPRIIGKQGSMVNMIKDSTGCNITVGQNGLIWLNGKPKNEIMAYELIKKIENEAHISGLTDKIKNYIENGKK